MPRSDPHPHCPILWKAAIALYAGFAIFMMVAARRGADERSSLNRWANIAFGSFVALWLLDAFMFRS